MTGLPAAAGDDGPSDAVVPIDIRRAVEDETARKALEERLRTAQLRTEAFSLDDETTLAVYGSHGGSIGILGTGEAVVIKYSHRSSRGETLGDVGIRWVRNEAAAYLVAQLIGCDDLVIPTVLKRVRLDDGSVVEAAVRLYVDSDGRETFDEGEPFVHMSNDVKGRAALFDYLVQQTDRVRINDHGGNWAIHRMGGREAILLLFDHQFCFGLDISGGEGGPLRSACWEIGQHHVPAHRGRAALLLTSEARAQLLELLPEDAVDGLQARARSVSS